MGETTAIGWTDSTFNGWIGCTEAGPGCDACYARSEDARYQWGVPPAKRTPGVAPHWGIGAPRHRTSVAYWRNPIRWNAEAARQRKPRKVFAHSLSDVFDKEVPAEWRADLFALWRATPWLRWIVVTKRAPLIKKYLPGDWGNGYPNVGLVATVVNQDEFDRDGPRLLRIPARWHGFSMEPQIGPIVADDLLARHRGSVWCITGGESKQPGHPARPYDIRWADRLLGVANAMRHVKVFVKQTGANPVGLERPGDGMGKDASEWPAWMRVQQFVPELLS